MCRKPHNMMVIASVEIKSPRTDILTNDTPFRYKFTDKNLRLHYTDHLLNAVREIIESNCQNT